MPKFQIDYDKKAKKDLKKLMKDKKLLAKAVEIIDEISEDPYSTTHKFEHLKYNLSGFCSKQLDKKNRIVYRVIDDLVVVVMISVLGHYDDK